MRRWGIHPHSPNTFPEGAINNLALDRQAREESPWAEPLASALQDLHLLMILFPPCFTIYLHTHAAESSAAISLSPAQCPPLNKLYHFHKSHTLLKQTPAAAFVFLYSTEPSYKWSHWNPNTQQSINPVTKRGKSETFALNSLILV